MKIKAIAFTKYGPPEVAQLMETPMPDPKENVVMKIVE